jgi:hypothetical protein
MKKPRTKIVKKAWIPNWPPVLHLLFEDKADAQTALGEVGEEGEPIPVSVVISEVPAKPKRVTK